MTLPFGNAIRPHCLILRSDRSLVFDVPMLLSWLGTSREMKVAGVVRQAQVLVYNSNCLDGGYEDKPRAGLHWEG